MHHIRQLKCAVALADHRHFSRAADAVSLTQSALTQNIQKLEEHYGVELFVRARGRVAPTAFGEIVVGRAREILDLSEATDREVGLLRNLDTGHLEIGVDPFLSRSVLSPALNGVLREHPNLKFAVRSGCFDKQIPHLLKREIDVLIGFPSEPQDERVQYRSHHVGRPILVCGKDHPLRTKRKIRLEDVLAFPLVSPDPPFWFLKWISEELGDETELESFTNRYMMIAESLHLVKDIVTNSFAVTAAPHAEVARELASGDVFEVTVKNWPDRTPFAVMTLSERVLPPAAERLVDEIETLN